ncbi:alpha/beta hydrolase [Lentzea kentuckyensis]|uniref:alpha/beta hydrolase n=1 Tax=Lentzea kentuckyensis TaxID=360086 RepID=UPI000A3653AB|nr:alpha/beta hydrolase fold domain-containing protein [Lentzea kentuckyensis]
MLPQELVGIRTADTTLGSRRALLVEPADRQRAGTILYFHGGSYVVGSPETALSLTGNLVSRTGLRAFSLDYRLAPEHPFPAAIDDAVAGIPPMLLQAGTNEVLLDDSTRMAARARAAGVDVVLDVTADVPHVFQAFADVLDEADDALDRAALFLTQNVRAKPRPAVGADAP